MARFELPIYGEDEQLIKKYEADRVRWGTLVEAAGLKEELEKKDTIARVEAIGDFLKNIFSGLTDEDLAKADYLDVINTFNQLAAVLGGLKANEAKND